MQQDHPVSRAKDLLTAVALLLHYERRLATEVVNRTEVLCPLILDGNQDVREEYVEMLPTESIRRCVLLDTEFRKSVLEFAQ